MKTVSLKVNEKRLVSNLGLAFSNSHTVITELAQNARRAGATMVFIDYDADSETLVVSDNGHGIDDFGVLFDVAGSGWESSVKNAEKAYGIGFLSAIYSARRISVRSNNSCIVAETQDLLDFKPVEVKSCKHESGTLLVLEGVSIDIKHFHHNTVFLGFPIRVVYNGQELKRTHAIEGDKTFIKTDVGLCYFKGFADDVYKDNYIRNTVFYYQGFPVARTGTLINPYPLVPYNSNRSFDSAGFSESDNICHVDEAKYDCRLPDRDKLIDQEKVFVEYQEVHNSAWVEKLKNLKSTLTPEQFVNWYPVLQKFSQLELLNDVDILPLDVLHLVEDYPVHTANTEDQMTAKLGVYVTHDEIKNKKFVVFDSMDDINPSFCGDEDHDARLWMAAYESNRIVSIQSELHQDHWLFDHVVSYDDVDIAVSEARKPSISGSDGLWNVSVEFCKGICITVPDHDPIHITRDSALFENGKGTLQLFVPEGCSDGEGVLQAQSFKTDDYCFDDDRYNECRDKLDTFIRNERLKNPADLLTHILRDGNIASFPSLHRKKFKVYFCELGGVTVIES